MFGTGDAGFWSDGKGNPVTPPSNIANPNPKSGTVNTYIADNNFSNCSDTYTAGRRTNYRLPDEPALQRRPELRP